MISDGKEGRLGRLRVGGRVVVVVGGCSCILFTMDEVHIGHYILGKTIGTGGFAKVKCTNEER